MLLPILFLISALNSIIVKGNVFQERYMDDPDEDTHLDIAFHNLIGIPHRSEEHDDVLANIELGKLVNEGVIKQSDIHAHSHDHDSQDSLDDEFHKMVGVPHRSFDEDDVLVNREIKKMVDEGKIKQTDVDLLEAMDTFDELMNTAEMLRRKAVQHNLNPNDIYGSMQEVVNNVIKAGEKLSNSKPLALNLLSSGLSQLENIDEALTEKDVPANIKFSKKRNLTEMDRKVTLQDMLNQFYIDKNVVQLPTNSRRTTTTFEPPQSKSQLSLRDMLSRHHLAKNVVKIPSKSPREARSAKAVDEKLLKALDSIKVFDEAFERLESNSKLESEVGTDKISTREKRDTYQTPSNLRTRGYSEDQYSWLLNEFNLTRDEVDSVITLNENQFSTLKSSLNESSHGEKYTMDDLIDVLKSARQLVPVELEAAAHGALHMGYHLGGRARTAADPVVKMVNNNVVPGAKKIWGDAVERIPDDVMNWAGDGQRIAAKRMQAIADYARPRLATMGKSMAKWQEVLSASAEETMKEFVPKLVPALQVLVAELQDTLELAREVIPPVVEKVGHQAAPYYIGVRDTMNENLIKPVYDVLTSERIARPVGAAMDSVSPIGRAAYDNVAVGSKVVYDEVSPVFSNIVTSSEDVMREKVMPAVEEARHQANKVGKTVQTSVRDVIKSTLDTVFDGVPKMMQQVGHEMHDAAKVFRGRYSSALGKIRSRDESQDGGPASVSPPVFRPTKAPKRTYVTSTELR